MRTRVWRWLAGLLALTLVAAACGSDDGGAEVGEADLAGETVEVTAVWSGGEQEAFEAVLAEFSAQTGAEVIYTSAGDDLPAALGTAIEGGDPREHAW